MPPVEIMPSTLKVTPIWDGPVDPERVNVSVSVIRAIAVPVADSVKKDEMPLLLVAACNVPWAMLALAWDSATKV